MSDLFGNKIQVFGVWFGLIFFWLLCLACRILVSQLKMEPMPSAGEAQNPKHWTAREVLKSRSLTTSIRASSIIVYKKLSYTIFCFSPSHTFLQAKLNFSTFLHTSLFPKPLHLGSCCLSQIKCCLLQEAFLCSPRQIKPASSKCLSTSSLSRKSLEGRF